MTVAGDAALVRRVRGIQGAELGNVILHEWIRGPPIDGYGVIAAGGADVVAYAHVAAGTPTFATDHIADTGPGNGVVPGILSILRKGHGGGAAAGKQRIEIAVIGARAVIPDG